MTKTMKTTSFHRILCPVDFSESSVAAIRYAAEIARRGGGQLTVLFVNDPLLGAAAAAAAYNTEQLAKDTTKELRALVARALSGSADVPLLTAIGHPAPEIAKAAARIKADLLVMGARGVKAPRKWVLGSVTERVLRSTSVPVLLVPRRKRVVRESKALRDWLRSPVLVPVDAVDYDLSDVRTALAAVHGLGARPMLFHAAVPTSLPAWLRVNLRAHNRERLAHASKAMKTLADQLGVAEYQVASGEPSVEIPRVAKSLDADLIVLTLKRGAGPFGPRRGAITYGLLCDGRTPILAIPERRARAPRV